MPDVLEIDFVKVFDIPRLLGTCVEHFTIASPDGVRDAVV